MANKAIALPISPDGRCDLFSAKRPRRAAKNASVIADAAQDRVGNGAAYFGSDAPDSTNNDPDFRKVDE